MWKDKFLKYSIKFNFEKKNYLKFSQKTNIENINKFENILQKDFLYLKFLKKEFLQNFL